MTMRRVVLVIGFVVLVGGCMWAVVSEGRGPWWLGTFLGLNLWVLAVLEGEEVAEQRRDDTDRLHRKWLP